MNRNGLIRFTCDGKGAALNGEYRKVPMKRHFCRHLLRGDEMDQLIFSVDSFKDFPEHCNANFRTCYSFAVQ